MSELTIEKLQTGIKQLDDSLKGGIPQNHIILLSGTAGTMKSSIAFQIAYANLLKNKKAIYISLEQSATSLITQMSLMSFDFSKVRVDSNNQGILSLIQSKESSDKKGLLTILDIGYVRAQQLEKGKGESFSWLKEIKALIKKYTSKGMADIVILDSLTALYHMEDFGDKRVKLFQVFEYIKNLKTTSLIINEMQPGDDRYSNYGMESYLADGVFLLSLKNRHDYKIRKFSIEKMRYIDHDMNNFVLKFKDSKFSIAKDLDKDTE